MSQFLINVKNLDLENKKIFIYKKDRDFYHIFKVYRVKIGEKLKFLDLDSFISYKAELLNFDDNLGIFKILKIYDKNEFLKNRTIILFQCITKTQKMDSIIEKAVELGIAKIVPVISQNVITKFNDEKFLEHKLNRWREIIISAVKQSECSYIPEIISPIKLDEIFENNRKIKDIIVSDCNGIKNINIIAWENGKDNFKENIAKDLKTYIKDNNFVNVNVLIGPEGGFSEKEIEKAKNFGWKSFRLNGNILRVETAAISIISLIKYELNLF
jgi:16S rRNA (uracil1498-N3)-methyltransferase